MKQDDVLQDYQCFLKKHRIGSISEEVFNRFGNAIERSDSEQIKRIIDEFSELKKFLHYRLAGGGALSWEDYQSLPDEEMVRRQDLVGLSYGLFNPVEVEMAIMRLIVDVGTKVVNGSNVSTIVDVGCGIGHRLSFFASREIRNSRCVGIDLSDLELARAKEIAQGEEAQVLFLKGPALRLPFPDESVGWIWSIDVLPWIKDWRSALKEAGRILQPDGFILLVYNYQEIRSSIGPNQAIRVLAESNIEARTLESRGLNSEFILGWKPK